MNETFQLAIQSLGGTDVRHLLAGGYAVNVRGYARGTEDLDLLIQEADRAKAHAAVTSAGFVEFLQNDLVTRYKPPAGPLVALDLMPMDGKTFSAMWAEATEESLLGCRVHVPSLDHILAMKLHTMKNDRLSRGLDDLLDVVWLVRRNSVDPRSERLRTLCLKFGDDAIYRSVLEALKPE